MFAHTVDEPVDRHVAPLVDAINRSGKAATYSSCSGHMKQLGFPFVAFKTRGWGFVGELRRMITDLNEVTLGQTSLEIASVNPEGVVSTVVRFRMYPWLWAPRINFAPLAAQLVFPPPRLVRLWWKEIEELARMVETDEGPAEAATGFFFDQRGSQHGFPRWGELGVVLMTSEPNPLPAI